MLSALYLGLLLMPLLSISLCEAIDLSRKTDSELASEHMILADRLKSVELDNTLSRENKKKQMNDLVEDIHPYILEFVARSAKRTESYGGLSLISRHLIDWAGRIKG